MDFIEVKTHPTFLENLISKYGFRPVKLPGLNFEQRAQAHVFPDSSRKVSFDETISYSHYRQLTRKQPRCIRKFVKINDKSV